MPSLLNWARYRAQRLKERAEDIRRYIGDPAALAHKFRAQSAAGPILRRPEVQAAFAVAREAAQEGDPKEGNRKYVNIARYVPLNLRRVYDLGLHAPPPYPFWTWGPGPVFSYTAAGFTGIRRWVLTPMTAPFTGGCTPPLACPAPAI